MKFCFTIDDNIIFLRDLTTKNYASIFDHPYLAVMKRLHEKYGIKVQFNLFYLMDGFDLSMATDKFKAEWESCADWIKFSFHSKMENVRPYENSAYDEVYDDLTAVNEQILRFAGEKSLAKSTTVHYCVTTSGGLKALKDGGVTGLLGLFGTTDNPRTSYSIDQNNASLIRSGETVGIDGISYGAIDLIINSKSLDDNIAFIKTILGRKVIKVMIHEQYFYPDYFAYQPDFEQKLDRIFDILTKNGYESEFFEDTINQ
ncbi:MAG: hypothetical protein IJY70_04035 [Clostridia bacterium]|nr:hypothetical protein [Clostridia bacterium]